MKFWACNWFCHEKLLPFKRQSRSLALYYYCLLFLLYSCDRRTTVRGEVSLTPSVISPCPGDQLFLVCNTSSSIHRWMIEDPNGVMHSRLIAVPTAQDNEITPLAVLSFAFSFEIISSPNTSPLISTLTVEGVNDQLNDSRIKCMEDNPSENSERVNVLIISPDITFVEDQQVDYYLMDPKFGRSNVSVELLLNDSWRSQTVEHDLLVYAITSLSQVEILRENRTSFQLVVPYNTPVDVSIAVSLCGQQSTSTIIQLSYTDCGHPFEDENSMNDSVIVIGLDDTHDALHPVMEGVIVTFACRPGWLLTDSSPNLSTCMKNGNWGQDPTRVKCRVLSNCEEPIESDEIVFVYNSTSEGSKLMYYCDDSNSSDGYVAYCDQDGSWVPFISCSNAISRPTSALMIAIITLGILIVFVTIVVLLLTFAIKRRGLCEVGTKLSNNQSNESPNRTYEDQSISAPSQDQVVYADLGPSSIKQSSILPPINLDDDRVKYAQLNYRACQQQQNRVVELKLQSKQDESEVHPADKLLNLDTLLIQLRGEVTAEWYLFGERLGLQKEQLEKFSNCPPEQSIVEMLDYWLRNHIGLPRWKEIAIALDQLGFQQLSREVDSLYKTGHNPFVERLNIDDCQIPRIPQSEPESTEADFLPPPLPPKTFMDAMNEESAGENSAPLLPPKNTLQLKAATVEKVPPRPPKPKNQHKSD